MSLTLGSNHIEGNLSIIRQLSITWSVRIGFTDYSGITSHHNMDMSRYDPKVVLNGTKFNHFVFHLHFCLGEGKIISKFGIFNSTGRDK